MKTSDSPTNYLQVDHRRLELLEHPVVSSLIHYKWFQFGLGSYIIKLLFYSLYLALLTVFAFFAPNPQSPECMLKSTLYCYLKTVLSMMCMQVSILP